MNLITQDAESTSYKLQKIAKKLQHDVAMFLQLPTRGLILLDEMNSEGGGWAAAGYCRRSIQFPIFSVQFSEGRG